VERDGDDVNKREVIRNSRGSRMLNAHQLAAGGGSGDGKFRVIQRPRMDDSARLADEVPGNCAGWIGDQVDGVEAHLAGHPGHGQHHNNLGSLGNVDPNRDGAAGKHNGACVR
jgi:hypothetical protein